MCAQAKPLNHKQVRAPAHDDAGDNGRKDKLRTALEELAHAAAKKHAEPICTAYSRLRHASRGMHVREMFKRADEALGQSSRDLIVTAYSHRHCFMCKGGIVACRSCRGSGQVEKGRKCLSCDGLGLTMCDFCRGTGWADRDSLPREIRPAVL